MGRKSALTPEQWQELIRRHMINGESIRSLAKEFGIAESSVREYIRAHKQKIEIASNQIVNATRALNSLPINAQITAHSLAQKKMMLQDGAADVAIDMMFVAKRLGSAAKNKVNSVTDDELLDSETMKGIMATSLVVNQALRPAADYLAFSVKEKIEDKAEDAIDEPVKFYLPSNGR